MTIQITDNDIREQAADWYDRLHELNGEEQQQYQRWLMQSPQHAAAMSWLQQQLGEHDEALLIALERVATTNHNASSVAAEEGAAVLSARGQRLRHTGLQRLLSISGLRWWPVPAALAMTLALVLFYPLFQQPPAPAVQPLSLKTAVGEQHYERLADGSEIHLNAGSAVSVALEENQRRVSLMQGEAFFSVAADKQRPFYVDTGKVQIRVVGTAFNVDNTADTVSVVVGHGEVRVTLAEQEWTLHAGDGLRIRDGHGERFQQEIASGWRQGWRHAEAEPLADVVAHLQRYSPRPIRLQGIEQTLPFSGRYNQSDVEGTLSLIASLFDLSLQLSDDLILLSGHDPEAH
ncbi:MAG: FecR domain-containing protein [Saccharospirillaceae bacterium]|nr:FecR domain-containing protein [Saccharospirillaceae bacterium]MCD8532870.1 FecR domain-containing protein [Saccharospirillaceae bacterium]